MGFGRKGAGGVWWLLLLAGVLLAVAAVAADAEQDGATATTATAEDCNGREHRYHSSHAVCEKKCAHWRDYESRQRCIRYCERWQAGGGGVGRPDVAGGGDGSGETVAAGAILLPVA